VSPDGERREAAPAAEHRARERHRRGGGPRHGERGEERPKGWLRDGRRVRALLQQEDSRGEGALEAEPVLRGGSGGEVGDERRRGVGRGRAGCRGQGLEREPRVVRAALGDGGE